ncbi:MAG: CAP domain-containing protein [Clostridia bacterium]|nr:CAP domain-containing protein [Clostridia bacterium]
MKTNKLLSVLLICLIILPVLAGCTPPSLLKPEESTTKAAFDEESFKADFYATSVPEETESTEAVTETTAVPTETETQTTEESTTVKEKITELTSAVTAAATTLKNQTKKITTTALTVIDTRIDKKETKSPYKYGVVKIDTVNTYYDIYSNGTEKQTKQLKYSSYDSSKYKASTSDLLGEAKSNKSAYYSQISGIADKVNASRSAAGVPALSVSDELNNAACVRAAEMAYSTKIGSKRPDGSNCYTVLTDLDIDYGGAFEITGKNANADAAASAMVQKAKANLNEKEYTSIGVGVAPMLGNDETENPQFYYCIIVTGPKKDKE